VLGTDDEGVWTRLWLLPEWIEERVGDISRLRLAMAEESRRGGRPGRCVGKSSLSLISSCEKLSMFSVQLLGDPTCPARRSSTLRKGAWNVRQGL